MTEANVAFWKGLCLGIVGTFCVLITLGLILGV